MTWTAKYPKGNPRGTYAYSEEQKLTRCFFLSGVASCPSVMLTIFPLGYFYNAVRRKSICFTKRSNSKNHLCNPFRGSNYKGMSFSIAHLRSCFRCMCLAQTRRGFTFPACAQFGTRFIAHIAFFKTDLLNSFRGMFFTKTYGTTTCAIFSTTLLPQICTAGFLYRFRGTFLSSCVGIAHESCAQFGTGLLRGFYPQIRSFGRFSNVEYGTQLINPVLLSLKQKGRENEFNNLEKKILLRILIPRILQFFIDVLIGSQFIEMLSPTFAHIDTAANVEFARRQTDDFVDATGSGNIRGLLNRVQWGHGKSSPNRCSSLEVIGADNACGLDSLDLYYTTTIPQQSSFLAPALYLLHLFIIPEKCKGGA